MRTKVAILGGGMAGLTAAYALTDGRQRGEYDVTIYQMGWRLGGKGASGRDRGGRILEHGLHVWFGFYENAFRVLRQVYDEWQPHPQNPFRTVDDAFVEQRYTLFGVDTGDQHIYRPVDWPRAPGRPGDGSPLPTPLEAVVHLVRLAQQIVRDWARQHPDTLERVYDTLRIDDSVEVAEQPLIGILNDAGRRAAEFAALPDEPTRQQSLREVICRVSHRVRREAEDRLRDDVVTLILSQLLDILCAFIGGLIEDFIVGVKTVDELDRIDFRTWLIQHGADRDAVENSDIIKSLYNTMFQYVDGDTTRPSYAAGTAIQVMLRVTTTYKGAVLYLMRAGMGEVVVAPLYEVLLARGVKFEFFSKVTRLELSADTAQVDAVAIGRQAELASTQYEPTIEVNGVVCWPAEPIWHQLTRGEELRRRRIDFESHWNTEAPAAIEILRRGIDFDDVVLALPLGAFKQFDRSGGPCDELAAASPEFRRMVDTAVLVPSQSMQIWSCRTNAEMGGPSRRAALVAGVPPFDIWAEMTSVLAFELPSGPLGPMSLHYLCGVMDSQLFRLPPSALNVPARAIAEVTDNAAKWLEGGGAALIWPMGRIDGEFDWNMLSAFDASNFELANPYLRANVGPADCCVGSPAGSTQWRLAANEGPCANLFLAGAWIRTGFNTECVESAVVSGLQAARAIIGSLERIPGEDFLRPPRILRPRRFRA